MGGHSSKCGGAIEPNILKAFFKNGYEYEMNSNNQMVQKKIQLDSTDGYLLDKELSTPYAQVYYNNHAVVVHRGTEPSDIKDIGNNITYAITGETGYMWSIRYTRARHVQDLAMMKYNPARISTIGHSQGGFLAKLVGDGTFEIITFNEASKPSAFYEFTKITGINLFTAKTPIIRIKTRDDPISIWNTSRMAMILDVTRADGSKPSAIEQHSTQYMISKEPFIGRSGIGNSDLKTDYILAVNKEKSDEILGINIPSKTSYLTKFTPSLFKSSYTPSSFKSKI